ncbi:MAG: exocyst complex component exo70 [Caeruleum heppii]|nr:MAG: exocyst complex component exo70 [Caeruleum heppii]
MVGQRTTSDEEDRAEVEVLNDRLEKTKLLTKKIQSSLNRLETSGRAVQNAIGPIYGDTQKLQVVGQNIDNVLAAIVQIRQPLNIRLNEERVIRAGPQAVGFSDFLASLRRINDALSTLKTTNLRSNQEAIAELRYLLKSGNQQLEKVFGDILKDNSRPVEPLAFITKQIPFPALSQDNISRLGLINSAAFSSGSQHASGVSPTAQIYADIRGPYLVSTLQNLAAASVTTAKKKVPDAIYRRGTNGIGSYATAMEALLATEYDNVCSLFSREDWSHVYSITCRGAIGESSRTLYELNAHIKSNITTDCFLAYEIVDIVTHLARQLDSKTGELKPAFNEALEPVRVTAKGSLQELLEDSASRIERMQVLPPDAACVGVTVETMTRLQNMPEYLASLSSIMTSLGDGNWMRQSGSLRASSTSTGRNFDVGADGRQLLAHYCLDTIDILLKGLESKGKTVLPMTKSKSTLGVFLANNVAVVDRMIRSSELGPLLARSMTIVETWRKRSISLYLDAWKDPSAYLLDVQYTNRAGQRPPSGSTPGVSSAEIIKGLSGKDKDAIKEKFRGFNTSFDELLSRHKSFRLEPEVRALLAREVQSLIEPLFGRFWDRYHEIDKGKGKYVKYDKAQVSGALASLG